MTHFFSTSPVPPSSLSPFFILNAYNHMYIHISARLAQSSKASIPENRRIVPQESSEADDFRYFKGWCAGRFARDNAWISFLVLEICFNSIIYKHTHTYACNMQTHTHARTHVHTHSHTRTCTPTHTHIHKRSLTVGWYNVLEDIQKCASEHVSHIGFKENACICDSSIINNLLLFLFCIFISPNLCAPSLH